MSGQPNCNRHSFRVAWVYLTNLGYLPVSPHFLEAPVEVESRMNIGPAALYRHVLPVDIFALSTCHAVVALPGWEQSKGCGLEKHAADLMDIPWVATDDDVPEDYDDLVAYLEDCVSILRHTMEFRREQSTGSR